MPPYYAPANSYRPSPIIAAYRDPPRANNYRPQYDDTTPWSHSFSRDPSQPLSAGYRRDSGPSARNGLRDSWSADAYDSYAPDTHLRGRQPRRPSWDSQYRGSRSRSRSISRRSSPYASSSKAMSTTSRGKRGAPRPILHKSRSRSRSRSHSFSRSRSRSRSLSSSDVASTRASERSSREPPRNPPQQPHGPPLKPLHEAASTGPPVKTTILLPPRPAPVAQKKPADNLIPSAAQIPQPQISTSISSKQIIEKDRSTNATGSHSAPKTQQSHVSAPTTLSVPKLAIQTNFSAANRVESASATTSVPKGQFSLTL
jgi:hypothetical protein